MPRAERLAAPNRPAALTESRSTYPSGQGLQ